MSSEALGYRELVPMSPVALAKPSFAARHQLAPLARATIFVRDVEVSLRLYRDLLGLDVMFDNLWQGDRINTLLGRQAVRLRAVVLMAGPSTKGNLGIYQLLDDDSATSPEVPTGGTRTGDCALVFPTRAITELATAIEAAGYPIISPLINLVERDDYLVQPAEMMFRDSDGILVNLVRPSVSKNDRHEALAA